MYRLEIKKAVEIIKRYKAKKVLLQLPDGLKPRAKEIQSEILKESGCDILIWAGSCFGACDIPKAQAEKLGADLIIQWGHSEWK